MVILSEDTKGFGAGQGDSGYSHLLTMSYAWVVSENWIAPGPSGPECLSGDLRKWVTPSALRPEMRGMALGVVVGGEVAPDEKRPPT